jgi:hypothetical protein
LSAQNSKFPPTRVRVCLLARNKWSKTLETTFGRFKMQKNIYILEGITIIPLKIVIIGDIYI